MKKLITITLCLLILLAGCTDSTQNIGTIPPIIPEEIVSTTESATMTALATVTVPANTESYCLEDGTEIFSYTSQHINLIFPNAAVADKVTLEFLNRVDATKAEADSILAIAQIEYADSEAWFPYFYRVLYSPMRIDQGVLSLFGIQNSYNGSMHGGLSGISVSYDMSSGDVLTLGSIMHTDATKEDFINLICEKLTDISGNYYLFDDFEIGVRTRLGSDENLYEDFYFTKTGLNFYFSPYEIAPYASGIITVEIPYEELAGLIYDGYFPDERESVHGSMKSATFMSTDMTQFNNMAEVMLSNGNELYVVYPEGTVEDVAITMPGDGMSIPDYTIFAALEMSDCDAIVLNVPAEALNDIIISYFSSGSAHSSPLVN